MGRNLRKYIIFSLGLLVVLAGVGLTGSGGYFVWLENRLSDDQGFYSSVRRTRIRTTSHAVVCDPGKIDLDERWPFKFTDWKSLRVQVRAGEEFFVGIAPPEDLEGYLSEVSYDRIDYFSIYPVEMTYRNLSGPYVPSGPENQSFWERSRSGSLRYDFQMDELEKAGLLVFMNRDGSSSLNFDLRLGLKDGSLLFAGLGMLIGGLLVLAIGGGIIAVSGTEV